MCRRLLFDSALAPHITDALLQLTYEDNWIQRDGMTVQQAISLAQAALLNYLQGGDICMRVGTIGHYITDTPPDGMLPLDGSTHSNADYPALAAVIHAAFDNGDGTFTLPDARGRVLAGTGTGPSLTPRTMADVTGGEQASLDISHLPPHTHSINNNPGVVQVAAGTGAFPQSDPGLPATSGSTGGGNPHDNMQPTLFTGVGVWYE